MSLPLIPIGLMGRSEPPSFPILRSTNNHAPLSLATSHPINLPAGVQAGDLLIVAYMCVAAGDMSSMPTPSGWDPIAFVDLSPGGVLSHGVRIISREAPSALSTVTVTSPGFSSGVCSNSYCFSKWTQVAGSAFVEGSSSGPKPPNLAPSGWGANPRVTWISLMAIRASVVSVTGTSSGFGNDFTSTTGGAPFGRISSSRRDERAASLDPGAWSLSGSQDWAAATIAVRGT
jgi:hypothetical protein